MSRKHGFVNCRRKITEILLIRRKTPNKHTEERHLNSWRPWHTHVFSGFLAPVLTQHSLQCEWLLLTCIRGERRNLTEKESLPQLGIEPAIFRPWVRYATNWATRPVDISFILYIVYYVTWNFSCPYFDPFSHNLDTQRPSRKRLDENIVGKGENAGYQHFLLFPQWFLSRQRILIFLYDSWNFCLQNHSVLKGIRFVVW